MSRLTEYKNMSPRARAVVEDIARRRNIDPADINNVWKAMARHPAVMERFAEEMKAAFTPGKLDPLTKELVYLAVSIANQCDYCIASHGTMARAKGMTRVARDAGLSRESLYKALSGERSPGFDTILKVVGALGLKLHAGSVSRTSRSGRGMAQGAYERGIKRRAA